MGDAERDMNFYPGRKNMFLKIKNKFRFVTVSFLLASLVTMISSASADDTTQDVFFPFEVEAPLPPECSYDDVPATWMPENATGALVVNPGDSVTVRVDPNFEHGITNCPDYSLDTTGYVTSTLTVPEGWTSSTECHPENPCTADPEEREIDGYFTVPLNAELRNNYVATFTLTWMTP
jgi:hypothetical protein